MYRLLLDGLAAPNPFPVHLCRMYLTLHAGPLLLITRCGALAGWMRAYRPLVICTLLPLRSRVCCNLLHTSKQQHGQSTLHIKGDHHGRPVRSVAKPTL